jgi:hypothetical protein
MARRMKSRRINNIAMRVGANLAAGFRMMASGTYENQ